MLLDHVVVQADDLTILGAWYKPLSVLADRNRGAGYLALALANIGVFSSILFLTYYFQKGIVVEVPS